MLNPEPELTDAYRATHRQTCPDCARVAERGAGPLLSTTCESQLTFLLQVRACWRQLAAEFARRGCVFTMREQPGTGPDPCAQVDGRDVSVRLDAKRRYAQDAPSLHFLVGSYLTRRVAFRSAILRYDRVADAIMRDAWNRDAIRQRQRERDDASNRAAREARALRDYLDTIGYPGGWQLHHDGALHLDSLSREEMALVLRTLREVRSPTEHAQAVPLPVAEGGHK